MNKNIFMQKRVYLDVKDTKLFPALGQASTIQQNALHFKNALETEIPEDKIFEDVIQPGWVRLKRNPKTKKTDFFYGQKKEEDIKDPSNDELMRKAIGIMAKRWNAYQKQYDAINGEGEYYATYGRYVNNKKFGEEEYDDSDLEEYDYEDDYDDDSAKEID
jgi:hypothetical protein